jgi:hypothetical protein
VASKSKNWVCPFCHRAQTVTPIQQHRSTHYLNLREHKYGAAGVVVEAVACANPECGEITLTVWFTQGTVTMSSHYTNQNFISEHKLRPASSAIPQPEYIPEAIRNDYYEACAIRDLSPKASATITRRCLQGMIRDFCGISKRRLIDEINELRERVAAGRAPLGVQPDTVDAIDDVRKIGNIGAHMEADINVIVDVDPDEAQILIGLVELLSLEWYVARAAREERLGKLRSIAADKTDQKQAPPPLPKKNEAQTEDVTLKRASGSRPFGEWDNDV